MHSTDLTFRINMGYQQGLPEDNLGTDEALQNLGTDEALQNFEDLKQHIRDILPSSDDLDHLASDIKVSLKNLHLCTFGLYNIQFTVTIQHDVPLAPQTIQEIAEIIFEHGANCPITFDETPNHFLYPYEIARIVGDDETVIGQVNDNEDDDGESHGDNM